LVDLVDLVDLVEGLDLLGVLESSQMPEQQSALLAHAF